MRMLQRSVQVLLFTLLSGAALVGQSREWLNSLTEPHDYVQKRVSSLTVRVEMTISGRSPQEKRLQLWTRRDPE